VIEYYVMVYGQLLCLILPHVSFYLWGNLKDRICRMKPLCGRRVKEKHMKRHFGSSPGRTTLGELHPIETVQCVCMYNTFSISYNKEKFILLLLQFFIHTGKILQFLSGSGK
jgi:hypothetical protein